MHCIYIIYNMCNFVYVYRPTRTKLHIIYSVGCQNLVRGMFFQFAFIFIKNCLRPCACCCKARVYYFYKCEYGIREPIQARPIYDTIHDTIYDTCLILFMIIFLMLCTTPFMMLFMMLFTMRILPAKPDPWLLLPVMQVLIIYALQPLPICQNGRKISIRKSTYFGY